MKHWADPPTWVYLVFWLFAMGMCLLTAVIHAW